MLKKISEFSGKLKGFSVFRSFAGRKLILHTMAGISVLFLASASRPVKKSYPANVRGLYVNKLPDILRDPDLQQIFLSKVRSQQFNHLVLYDLHQVLAESDLKKMLPGFIRSCRAIGVTTIAAAGENASFFRDKIMPYQHSAGVTGKFDNYYLEFEFWRAKEALPGGMYSKYISNNRLKADTSGLFSFYRDQLIKINKLAKESGVGSSTYVGWLNEGQASFIAENTDQVWVHAYFRDPDHLYGYSKSRLKMLKGKKAEVYPIFSAEPEFSGPWSESSAFSGDLYDAFVRQAGPGDGDFNEGYMWFAQSFLFSRLLPGPVASK